MLHIDDTLLHVQQAKALHAKYITCYVKRKIYGRNAASICSDAKCPICQGRTQKVKASIFLISLFDLIDIQKLIEGSPAEILKINNDFRKMYSAFLPQFTSEDKESLNSIFNYEWFESKKNILYNAYDLCGNLKIETCVYCNRLYTSTIVVGKKEMIIRPTLDHWFPQAQYPLLALSFYNLIPSCSPCNSSVKHSNPFKLRTNIHPYVEKSVTNDYHLESTYDKSVSTFKIKVKSKSAKILSTMKAMKIAEIYEHHQSELADLEMIRKTYGMSYLRSLGKLLGTKLSEKEVYRLMFGVEYDDQNFYKRPLSKLKKDILTRK
jgi:hypothetical protein